MANPVLTNPFSSGGGGTAFELRVASCYLVSMLRNEVPRGLGAGTAESIRFQARQIGVLLDDLLITSFDGDQQRHLALQIKHKLTISKKDPTFREVMFAAWHMYHNAEGWQFQRNSDRLGLAFGETNTAVREHLVPMLEWARACQTGEEFVSKIMTPQFSHKHKQEFLDIFRAVLAVVAGRSLANDELWMFLRHLVVLTFDLEYEGSRDATIAWNSLLDMVPNRDTSRAGDAFGLLVAQVSAWAPLAATVNIDQVRGTVASLLSLPSASTIRADLRRLEEHSARVVNGMRDTLADSYCVPRTYLVEQAWTALTEAEVVFITGDPGSGKSGVLRSVVRRLGDEGQIVVVRADELGYPMLEDFLHSLGLQHSFDELLHSLSAPRHRCLVIDGLERSLSLEKQGCLHDLLSAIVTENFRQEQQGLPREFGWKIICTCRAHLVESVVDELLPLAKAALATSFRIITVNSLTDEEMGEVLTAFPAVRTLWAASHLRELLRLPLILDIITRQHISLTTTAASDPATETWFAGEFWSTVVRRSSGARKGMGRPNAREQVMLRLAQHCVERGWIGLPIQEGLDSAAVEGLVHDKVLRDEDATISFAHDVFGDWALYKLLAQPGRDVITLVETNGEPRLLDRPVQLLACHLLERSRDAKTWHELLTAFGSRVDLSPRWQHLVLTAPLFSSRLHGLLPLVEPFLIANDGILLDQLCIALMTIATEPDPVAALLYQGVEPEKAEQVLPYLRIPLQAAWTPVLELLIRLGSTVPLHALLPASDVLRIWMEKTQPGTPLRQEVAHLAFSLLFREEAEED